MMDMVFGLQLHGWFTFTALHSVGSCFQPKKKCLTHNNYYYSLQPSTLPAQHPANL